MKKIKGIGLLVLTIVCINLVYKWNLVNVNAAIPISKEEIPEGYIGIYTAEELDGIRNDLTANYILMNDIDLSEFTSAEADYNAGKGWIPLGDSEDRFTGVFDGNGYKIHGMQIQKNTGKKSVGLFGYVSGTVRNLTLDSSKIKFEGDTEVYVGGITGVLDKGTLENCISNTVIENYYTHITGSQTMNTGGVVGCIISGQAVRCNNRGSIKLVRQASTLRIAYDISMDAGGIAGFITKDGVIEECYNTGEVYLSQYNVFTSQYSTPNSYVYIGGVAGKIDEKSMIRNSYNTGNLDGESYHKDTNGKKVNSYLYIGGVCGYSYDSMSSLEKCFSTGILGSLTNKKGYGIIDGFKTTAPEIKDCYYLKETASYGMRGMKDTEGICNALDSEGLKMQSAFVNYDFIDTWMYDIDLGVNTPQLLNNPQIRVEEIKMSAFPDIVTYVIGSATEVNVTGAKIGIRYENGVTREVKVTPDMISGYNLRKIGKQFVKVAYEGRTCKYQIEVQPISIKSSSASLSTSAYTYDGKEKRPQVTVKLGNKTLVEKKDYTIQYKNNMNAGTASVVITGMGDYAETITKSYKIQGKSIAKMTTLVSEKSFEYNGTAKKPNVVLIDGNKVLLKDKEYTLTYQNNVNAGTASVIVTGKGNYSGTQKLFFKITSLSAAKFTVSSVGNKEYTGKAIKPSITVKYASKTLKSGVDYTLAYSNNNNVGKATISVVGKGNYSGTKKTTFYIAPKKVVLSTVKCKKTKTATVDWKKDSKATGYEVVYATSKNGTYKSAGITTKNTFTISKLSKNKTYYVKVRSYKLIDGKKVYGSYCSAKTVKIK